MTKSDTIAELAKALAKAQAMMEGAKQDAENPFFKSRYSTLSSVWDACRKPLSENGLSVVQPCSDDADGKLVIETTLLHSSGEWITGRLALNPVKNDPQGIGSAITYGRRYSLAAMVGISPEDDDAEKAMDREKKPAKQAQKQQPAQPLKPQQETPPPDKPAQPRMATEAQIRKIYMVTKENGNTQEYVHEAIKTIYGVNSTKELTLAQASEFIKMESTDQAAPSDEAFDNLASEPENFGDLFTHCQNEFGLTSAAVATKLGYGDVKNLQQAVATKVESLGGCYQRVKEMMEGA